MSVKVLILLSLVAVVAASPAPTLFPVIPKLNLGGGIFNIVGSELGATIRSLFGGLIGNRHVARTNGLEAIEKIKIKDFGDVCQLTVQLCISLSDTIEASITGLGNLISRVFICLMRIIICFLGNGGNNPVCSNNINRLVGVSVTGAADTRALVQLYGLTDCRAQLNYIIRILTKGRGITSCRNSMYVVVKIAQDLVNLLDGFYTGSRQLTRDDLSFCFENMAIYIGVIGNTRKAGSGLDILKNYIPVCNLHLVKAGFKEIGNQDRIVRDCKQGDNDVTAPWSISDVDISATADIGGIIGLVFRGLNGVTRLSVNLLREISGIALRTVDDVFTLIIRIVLGLGGVLDATISGLGSLLVRIVAGLLKIVLCFNGSGKYGICRPGWDKIVGVYGNVNSIDLVISSYGLGDCWIQVNRYIDVYTGGRGVDSLSGSIKNIATSSITLSNVVKDKSWKTNVVVTVFAEVTKCLGSIGNSNSKGVGTAVCNKFIPVCDKLLSTAGFVGFGNRINEITATANLASDDDLSWTAGVDTGENKPGVGFINNGVGVSVGGSGVGTIGGIFRNIYGTINGVGKLAVIALKNIIDIKVQALKDVFSLFLNLSFLVQVTLDNLVIGFGSFFTRLVGFIIKIAVCVKGFPGDKSICSKDYNAKWGISDDGSTVGELLVAFKLGDAKSDFNNYVIKCTKGKGIKNSSPAIRNVLEQISLLIDIDFNNISMDSVTKTFISLTIISGSIANSQKKDSGKQITQQVIPQCGKYLKEARYEDISLQISFMERVCSRSNGDNVNWNGGGDNTTPSSGGDNTTPSSQGDEMTPSGGDSPTPQYGGDETTPSGGDSPTPSSGGDSTTPSSGGDSTTPRSGGDKTTPSGGRRTTLSSGGDKTTPSGGDSTTPSSGGDSTTPRSGGDKTTPSGGHRTTPSSGGYKTTPSSGGDRTTPSSGRDSTTPRSGGDKTTPSGGDSPTPQSGGDETTPSGGDSATPSSGGDSTTPSSGGDSTTPRSGGDKTTPSGGRRTTPSSGGDKTTPSGGDSTTPSSGGDSTTPRSGGDKTTPSGGHRTTPSSGGYKTTPSSGGDKNTPSGGDTTTPSGGDTTTPSSEGVKTTPSGGDKNTPSQGDSTTPSSEGDETTPSGGDSTTPSSGGDKMTPSGGDKNTPSSEGDETTPSGGDSTTPSSGGDEMTPSGGDSTTPSSGDDSSTPSGGDSTNTPSGGDKTTPSSGGDKTTTSTGGTNVSSDNSGTVIAGAIKVIPGVTKYSINNIQELISIKLRTDLDVINLVSKLILALGGFIDLIATGLGSIISRMVAVFFKIGYCVYGWGSSKAICNKEFNAPFGVVGEASTAGDLIALYRLNTCQSDVSTIIKGYGQATGIVKIIFDIATSLSTKLSSGKFTREDLGSVITSSFTMFTCVTNSYSKGSGTTIIRQVISICGPILVKQGLPDIRNNVKVIVDSGSVGDNEKIDWNSLQIKSSKNDEVVSNVKDVVQSVKDDKNLNKASLTAVLNLEIPINFDGVMALGVKVIQALGDIVDVFISGFGSLLVRVVGALINYIVAILGAARNSKSFVAQKAYYDSFSVTVTGQKWTDVMSGFNLTNCQSDYDNNLSTYTEGKGIDSLSGSVKLFYVCCSDLITILLKREQIAETDLSVVISNILTMFGGFANSCSADLGSKICANIAPVCSSYLVKNSYSAIDMKQMNTRIAECNNVPAPWSTKITYTTTTTVVQN